MPLWIPALFLASAAMGAAGDEPTARATWIEVLLPPSQVCLLGAEIGARLERTPNLLVRTTSSAREREDEGSPTVRLRISPVEVGAEVELTRGAEEPMRAVAGHPSDALDAIWPADLPRLAPPIFAPNAAALEAACAGDAVRAAAAAGAAIGPLLPRWVALVPGRPRTTAERWARGLARARPAAARWRDLLAVVRALEGGEVLPAWRREATSSTVAPSSITTIEDRIFVFSAKDLSEVDPRSGRDRWRTRVGRADPTPISAGREGPLLVTTEEGLLALDVATGEERWRRPLSNLQPGLLSMGPRIFAVGDDVWALERATGETIWRRVLPTPAIAGPVEALGRILVPVGHEIRVFETEDGAPRPGLVLEDEISGPLVPTRLGRVWVLVGGGELRQYDPRRWFLRTRLTGAAGLAWPPVQFGDQLAVLIQRGRRQASAWVDPSARRDAFLDPMPAASPLVERADFAGSLHPSPSRRRLIGRDPAGRPNLGLALERRATALATAEARVLVGGRGGIERFRLDPPRRESALELEDVVVQIAIGASAEVARLSSGELYGWPVPGDPARQAWLQWARQDLADAALEAERPQDAFEAASAVLARSPSSLRALRVRAEAAVGPRASRALEAWLAVAARAPAGAPLARRAETALAAMGVRPALGRTEPPPLPPPLQPPPPVRALGDGPFLEAGPTWIVGSGDQVVAVDGAEPRWTFRPRGERVLDLERQGDGVLVWTDRALHRLTLEGGRRTGRVLLPRPLAARARAGAHALVHDGEELTRVELDPPRLGPRLRLTGVRALRPSGAAIRVELDDGFAFLVDPSAFGPG